MNFEIKARILIVEDEAITAENLKRMLMELGHEVVGVVYEGQKAIDFANKERPDLILMDIKLKGRMDGIEAAARICEVRRTPVIFTTAYANEELLSRTDLNISYGYILKPFTRKDLWTAITIALNKKRQDRKIMSLNSLLSSIRNVSRLITHQKNVEKLMQGTCDNLIQTHGYSCVMGLLLDEKQNFILAKYAGTLKNKDSIFEQLQKGRLGNCMLKAVEQTEVYIHDKTDAICRDCPMSIIDHEKSAMTMGLHHRGRCFGAICISVPKGTAITEEEKLLLKEIGADIAYAFSNIEEQQKRQKMSRELHKANEIINASPAVAFLWRDEEGWPIEYVSRNVSGLFGYTSEELLSGKIKYSDLIHPDDLEEVKKEAVRSQIGHRQKMTSNITYRIRTKAGEIKWVKDSTTIYQDESGVIDRYQGIIVNITDQIESEKRLLNLGMAINELTEGIVITNIKGNIEYVNKGFEKITQYSFEEVKGKNPRILKSGKTDPGIYKELWHTILSGKIWAGDLTNRRKDGSDYIENMTIVPLKNENEGLTGFIAIKRDVSEKLLMERELRQAQKLESIGQLAAGIAHEINTPIQYIGDNIRFLSSGFKDLLKILNMYEGLADTLDDPDRTRQLLAAADTAKGEMDLPFLLKEIPDSIRQSLEGVGNITRIVRAMKEFSHPGSREKTMTDINHCITTTITVAKNEWKYYAEVLTDLDPGLPSTLCLPGELNQVLLNLITNAAQALAETPEVKAGKKGKINISTWQCEGKIVITVADNGPGIPAELQHRVFDPFFTTKEPGKGTGQGLTIAYTTVVEKLQGEIYFKSDPEHGTTFTIKIPILQNDEVEDEN